MRIRDREMGSGLDIWMGDLRGGFCRSVFVIASVFVGKSGGESGAAVLGGRSRSRFNSSLVVLQGTGLGEEEKRKRKREPCRAVSVA